jgi:hypothetical protein
LSALTADDGVDHCPCRHLRPHRCLPLRRRRRCKQQTFNFLGLPPEVRLIVYGHTLPANRTYYMTARNHRFYGHLPHEDLKDEIISEPLSILRVCHLVYDEIWPLIYNQFDFYITVYSVRDLLYIMDLLERYEVPRDIEFPVTDIFFNMTNIQIRVSDLVTRICPNHDVELSQTTPLWIGPGATTLLKTKAQVAEMVRIYGHGRILMCSSEAAELKSSLLDYMFRNRSVNKCALNKMLPWYQRLQHQRNRKLSASPV